MEFKDYYDVLGVARDAGDDEIKKAYRRLARKYHPDVSKEADAEARFKEVSEAYEVLKDAEKRSRYDQLGNNWKAGQDFRPPPEWYKQFESGGDVFTSGSGFSDFFDSLFGANIRNAQRAGGAGRAQYRAARKGQDQQATIKISLEDAYHGATRTINLGGQGYQSRTLNVKIPKGVTAGQKIRLSGQGAPGPGGSGDLLLEIGFSEHRWYRVDKRDIHLDLPITPWEAALGASVTAPTLGGKVDLKVNPGARSGQKLRLKGRGLPGDPPGDQYVHLQIITPPADTQQAKDWYRKMAEELPLDPRAELGV